MISRKKIPLEEGEPKWPGPQLPPEPAGCGAPGGSYWPCSHVLPQGWKQQDHKSCPVTGQHQGERLKAHPQEHKGAEAQRQEGNPGSLTDTACTYTPMVAAGTQADHGTSLHWKHRHSCFDTAPDCNPYSSGLLTTWGQLSEFQTCFPGHRDSKSQKWEGKPQEGYTKHTENTFYPSSPLPEVGCIPILLSLRNKERLQLWQHCCDCTRAVSDNTQLSHCWAKVMRASELWKRSWRHRSAHDEAMALGKVSVQVAKAKALLARNYF